MKKIVVTAAVIFIFLAAFCQESEFKQTIRGKVIDKQTEHTLPGANVVLPGTDPLMGTITDENGYFKIENVPVGRHTIQVSFLGYNTITLQNLLLNTGKELVLTIEMEERVLTSEEVVVTAKSRKDQPLNNMAVVSARSFSVEESNRYAGSFGDPARMVANYAGVISVSNQRNDIIIRGNAPTCLLWRLDGMEIPNPNHFGALGTTGGPVSILNNNLLTNSDFFTGAFPAEYGNAIGGAFDLKMRAGNNEQREYWGQLGFNGFELGAEGPFSKESKSSYLLSYRYSMLDAMRLIGFDMGIAPQYQDLTFKLNFPSRKYGKFTLIGMGGLSYIEFFESEEDQEDWALSNSGEDLKNGSDMGILGLSHLFFFDENTRLNTTVSALGSIVKTSIDTFHINHMEGAPWYRESSSEMKYTFSTKLSKKFNAKNNMSIGFTGDLYRLNYNDSVFLSNHFITLTDVKDDLPLLRGFAQWQHKLTDDIALMTGIYSQYLTFNNTYAIEPRLGFKWNFIPNHALNLGYGKHSQTPIRLMYFVETKTADDSYIRTNEGLELMKSDHYVIGYDYRINEHLRLKTETYYQYLYDIPVKTTASGGYNSIYSIINSGADFHIPREDSLVNKGTGQNYGVEFTLEKFYSKNYYFLVTLSLFESTFKAIDGEQRNTVYNGNFVFNSLGGYEWNIDKKNTLNFNLKATWAGGKRYIPYDLDASRTAHRTIYQWDKAYEAQYPYYLTLDLRIVYKRNHPNMSQEWGLDLQNLTGQQNVFMENFDPETGEVKSFYQLGFFPMMTYRILF